MSIQFQKWFCFSHSEYIAGDIENLSNLHNLTVSKTHHLNNRLENLIHPTARIPSKDPVLNDVHQTGIFFYYTCP